MYVKRLLYLLATSADIKVHVHDTWILTQGIEGRWKHANAPVNACGGSRDHVLQERLDEHILEEYMLHRTYLRDNATNVHILG